MSCICPAYVLHMLYLFVEAEPVYCAYSKRTLKLTFNFCLLIEDYAGKCMRAYTTYHVTCTVMCCLSQRFPVTPIGLPASLHNRVRGRMGANAWTDVEGVQTAGMHWLSAVRHLPEKDPLRDVFAQEFVAKDSIVRIAKMKPPKRSTTAIAKRIAGDDSIPVDGKRYLNVSTFHGTPCFWLVLATMFFFCMPNHVALCWCRCVWHAVYRGEPIRRGPLLR